MPKDTLDVEKMQRSDHDTLIRLEVLVTNISGDIKEMRDGITKTLADHELRLKTIEAVHDSVKPEQIAKEFRELQTQVRDFIISARTARYFVGVITSMLGALFMYVLTKFPELLKFLNISK